MFEEPIVLYTEAFWQSPWDCSCWVALREKGVPFGRSVASLQRSGISAQLAAQVLAPRVPALQHGSFFLDESQAIVEYLDEVFPAPRFPRLLPRDPRDRARARQIMLFARTALTDMRRERPAWMIFYDASPLPLSHDAVLDADELITAASRLLVGRDGAFAFGGFSIADVDLAFSLQRLRKTGTVLPPEVTAYVDRVWTRPSVKEFVDHPRPPHPPVL